MPGTDRTAQVDLTGYEVLVAVCGGISAYKSAYLVSSLVQHGAGASVAMTAAAQKFITPLPFKTLSRNPVVTDLYDEDEGWKPTHIELADAADLLLVAPATANCIAKLAHGLADDALSCIALALNPRAKILIAPAMNGKMWQHPATQQNVATLSARGADFLGPEEGMLSCGYEGIGRLWPVEKIAAAALAAVSPPARRQKA
jgi:phosphopantothenoylcysteine synthetase/decarboxylase